MKLVNGQVAIEFMVIFAIFLVAVTISLFFVWENTSRMNRATLESETRVVANAIAGKLDTVYLEGDGFSTNLTVPQLISGMNYTLELTAGTVWVTLENRSYGRVVLPSNISGTLRKGVNVLRNSNGMIVIS
jgi:CheY-specific phosphatase CheX